MTIDVPLTWLSIWVYFHSLVSDLIKLLLFYRHFITLRCYCRWNEKSLHCHSKWYRMKKLHKIQKKIKQHTNKAYISDEKTTTTHHRYSKSISYSLWHVILSLDIKFPTRSSMIIEASTCCICNTFFVVVYF